MPPPCIPSKEELVSMAADAIIERETSIEWARATADEIPEGERNRIGRMDYKELKAALHSGSVSAFAALCTYLDKALAVHERTNCAVLFLKESASIAKELDAKAEDPSYSKPPLFGVPFSNKESVPMAGQRNTRGSALRLGVYATEDVTIIDALRRNGGVPFVLTNVPFCCMAYDTINSIWGTTINPHRADRSAGGSSGGEGALIGGGGSLLGIGSDIAGSNRNPAASCGIAAFKGTGQRVSLRGYGPGVPARPFVWPVDGPLCSTIEAAADVLRLTYSGGKAHTRDAFVAPVDWREDLFREGRQYKIGVLGNVMDYRTSPGQLRALGEARGLLEVAGHRVVHFAPPDLANLHSLLQSMTMLDGGEGITQLSSVDLVPPEFAPFIDPMSIPIEKRAALAEKYAATGEIKLARATAATLRTAGEVQKAINDVYNLREAFADAMVAQGIDAILCPTTLTPALKAATSLSLTGWDCNILCWMFNLMDFAAGALPLGKWTSADTAAMADYDEKELLDRTLKKDCQDAVGLPLSVQIAAPPFRDEMALRILVDLERAIKAAEAND